MRRTGLHIVGLTTAALLITASCEKPSPQAQSALVGKPAPGFKTVTLDDEPIALADLKGKVVLIDFWATWCGPCMMAMPATVSLSEKFKDKGVVVLGVNQDRADALASVRQTVEQKGMKFPQALDPMASISRSYGIDGIPTMILVDGAGVVRSVHVGYSPDEESTLGAEIEDLLKHAK